MIRAMCVSKRVQKETALSWARPMDEFKIVLRQPIDEAPSRHLPANTGVRQLAQVTLVTLDAS
jgi:hypothetical protein